MDTIRLLESVPIFSGTPAEALAELVDLLEEVSFEAGRTIIEDGEWSTTMYIIVEGRVRVDRGGRTFTYLQAGDVFGEMASLNSEPRSASIIAVEDTRLLRLDQAPLFDLLNRQPIVAQGIVRNIGQRLQASMHDMVDDYLYIQQVSLITAAAADVERGLYKPERLDEVAQRTDELGQLARVFQTMVREVHLREQQLRHEMQQLRIEINEVKRQQQVQQVVETDYFHQLQVKAQELRRSRSSQQDQSPVVPD